jgi:hypothetical protein
MSGEANASGIAPTSERSEWATSIPWFRILSVLGVLVAIGLVALSGRYQEKPVDPTSVDSAVERFIPADGSPSILRQAPIGIDLAEGWTAVLTINGVRIPEDEYRRNGPQNEVFFTPGEGKVIERLAAGPVVVSATLWRPVDGHTETSGSRSVSWRFRVS